MTTQEAHEFENKLLEHGYKKWTVALHGTEDYDVAKKFQTEDGVYVVICRFWDWTKYNRQDFENHEMSVDVVIVPCFDGRADLDISATDKVLNIEWVEEVARDYNKFIMEKFA